MSDLTALPPARTEPAPCPPERAAASGAAPDTRSLARLTRLQALTAALAQALTAAQVADAILTHGRAALAATSGVVALLSDDERRLVPLQTTGYPQESVAAWPTVAADAAVPLAEAVRRRALVALGSWEEGVARYPQLAATRQPGADGALLALPLLVGDRPLGAIGLSFAAPQRFTADDRAFARSLANLCAQALDRAALHDAERQARAEAEALARRLQAGQAIMDTALTHLSLDDLLQHLLARVRTALAVDTVVILLPTAEQQALVVRAALGLEAAVAAQVHVPLGQGLAGRIAATRQPLIVDDLDQAEVVSAYLRERMRSLLGVPLLVEERLIGVLHVGSVAPRHFGEDDLGLLQVVATRAALAIENAHLYEAERQARAAAEAAVRQREDLLRLATHDLRSPLTALSGRAQVVQRRLEAGRAVAPAWVVGQMGAIRASVARMRATIDEMADVARLHAGEALELTLDAVDLGRLAHDVAEEVSAVPGAPYVDVDVDAAGPVLVRGDRHRLARVLQNVVGNAVKYSPEGAPVCVTVRPQGPWVVLCVTDQGVGIPVEELGRIFTPYFRASTARTTAGTGLGLWGARAIVTQHGGGITLQSAVGQGTTVTVRLPQASAPLAAAPADDAQASHTEGDD